MDSSRKFYTVVVIADYSVDICHDRGNPLLTESLTRAKELRTKLAKSIMSHPEQITYHVAELKLI